MNCSNTYLTNKVIFSLIFTLFLFACGGGGSTEKSPIIKNPAVEVKAFTLTATSGDGGSISPNSVVIDENKTTSFTVTAETAYVIGRISGCEGQLNGNTYATGAIHSICIFNGDISTWDVSSVIGINYLFRETSVFKGDLSSWGVSKVVAIPILLSSAL